MMRSLAVVALAASAAGACVEIEDIASYAPAGTQYCGMSTWCKDVSCFDNAGTWARLGSATCKADSSDNLCGATTSNCGSYGINKATLDCSAYDCIPGDDDDNPRTSPDCTKSSSSSTPSSSSSGSSSQTSNEDDVEDDDKMMTLVVLAGLLGLSLAIAAGLFALRQQQLAAEKSRAPRMSTVTAVEPRAPRKFTVTAVEPRAPHTFKVTAVQPSAPRKFTVTAVQSV